MQDPTSRDRTRRANADEDGVPSFGGTYNPRSATGESADSDNGSIEAGDSEAGEPSRTRSELTETQQVMAEQIAELVGRNLPEGQSHLTTRTAGEAAGGAATQSVFDVFDRLGGSDGEESEDGNDGGLLGRSASGIPLFGTDKSEVFGDTARPGSIAGQESASDSPTARAGALKPADGAVTSDDAVGIVTGVAGAGATAVEGVGVAVGTAAGTAVVGAVAGGFGLGWTLGRIIDRVTGIGDRIVDAIIEEQESGEPIGGAGGTPDGSDGEGGESGEDASGTDDGSGNAGGEGDTDAGATNAGGDEAGDSEDEAGTPDVGDPGPDGYAAGTLAQRVAFAMYLRGQSGYTGTGQRGGDVDPDDNPAIERATGGTIVEPGGGLKGDNRGEIAPPPPLPDDIELDFRGANPGAIDPSDDQVTQVGTPGMYQDTPLDQPPPLGGNVIGSNEGDDDDDSGGSTRSATSATSATLLDVDALQARASVARRVTRDFDAFEARVRFERPVEDTSVETLPTSAVANEAEDAEAGGSDYQPPAASSERVIVTPAQPVGSTVSDADREYAELARQYLKDTGRYTDVDSMSYAELNEAMETEAQRELLGITHNVHLTREQLASYASVQSEEMNSEAYDNARDSLVASGHFTEDEVQSMSNDEVAMALGVLQRIGDWDGPASAVRVIDDETTVVQNGTSLRINWSGSNASPGSSSGQDGDDAAAQSGGTSSTSEPTSDSNSDGGDDDDDDKDDKDDDSGDSEDTESTEETPVAEAESEDSEEGKGEGTAETTPHPDAPVTATPAEVAAFAASPLARDTNRMADRAIEMGIGGGLTNPDSSDEAARAAFIETGLAASELATLGRGIEVARSGGHTDPVEDSVARGVVPIDELKAFGGAIDPIDDASGPIPEDNPLFPIAPGGLAPGGVASELQELLEDSLSDLQSGQFANLRVDADELAENLGEVSDQ